MYASTQPGKYPQNAKKQLVKQDSLLTTYIHTTTDPNIIKIFPFNSLTIIEPDPFIILSLSPQSRQLTIHSLYYKTPIIHTTHSNKPISKLSQTLPYFSSEILTDPTTITSTNLPTILPLYNLKYLTIPQLKSITSSLSSQQPLQPLLVLVDQNQHNILNYINTTLINHNKLKLAYKTSFSSNSFNIPPKSNTTNLIIFSNLHLFPEYSNCFLI